MRIAFDTNILIYAYGAGAPDKVARSEAILAHLAPDIVLPTQVLGEAYNVLVRKLGLHRTVARHAILFWQAMGEVAFADNITMAAALDLATDHRLQIWDAVILATAHHAGCDLLLSENMHHGFQLGALTIVDPFHSTLHPLLQAALAAD